MNVLNLHTNVRLLSDEAADANAGIVFTLFAIYSEHAGLAALFPLLMAGVIYL